jgi:hypothetical protein
MAAISPARPHLLLDPWQPLLLLKTVALLRHLYCHTQLLLVQHKLAGLTTPLLTASCCSAAADAPVVAQWLGAGWQMH